jgi:hypothetical protein
MLIALLIALGVDLAVVVVFAVFLFGRRRWLKRQPGEFAGAIRVSAGAVGGLSLKWKRGSGAGSATFWCGARRRSCSAMS